MTNQSSAAPAEEPKTSRNCFLWGCLAVVILFVVTLCCLGTLVLIPFFTDFDPLGLDIRDQIEQYIPLDDFLDDSSGGYEMPEFFDDGLDLFSETDSGTDTSSEPVLPSTSEPDTTGQMFDLSTYIAGDFQAVFDYPTGWQVEPEEYGVTFYDLDTYTFLYVGEVLYDEGTSPVEIAGDVMSSLMEEAEAGSFVVLEETPLPLPTDPDAYLIAVEFTDSDGYYQWVLDLETISGESNVYFYLSGENSEDFQYYRDLIEVIGESFSR